MRYFILLMEEIPEISRGDIDKGAMNQETVSLVNCVRSSLFTSYGVRRDVNVMLCPSQPSDRLTRIEGNKLRYMGPNERSISILLSISAKKLMSENAAEKQTSSPGITIERRDLVPIIGPDDKLNALYGSPDGLDLRRVKLTEKTVFVAKLNGRLSVAETRSLLGKNYSALTAVKSTGRIENTITLLNNEIDRQLARSPATL